jgi:hypothetical protein
LHDIIFLFLICTYCSLLYSCRNTLTLLLL